MDLINQLLLALAGTVQFKILVGLIFLNLVLGISAALRTGSFDWLELAAWYRGAVLPYVIGYIGLFVTVNLILPADLQNVLPATDAPWTEWLNAGAVNFAWLTLIGTLGYKLIDNARLLYGGR